MEQMFGIRHWGRTSNSKEQVIKRQVKDFPFTISPGCDFTLCKALAVELKNLSRNWVGRRVIITDYDVSFSFNVIFLEICQPGSFKQCRSFGMCLVFSDRA